MKGFTLVESLVVVTIILILLVTVLVNYRVGERNLSLDESTAILGQNFRKVEEMAMSAKEFHDIIPQGGYGINLKTEDDFYIIFADCNNDYQYTLGNLCNGYPEMVEQVALGKRSKIASLLSGSYLSVMNVVFIPPSPSVMISGSGTEAVIKLTLKEDASAIGTVRVNKAGLIEAF
jgi:prepilin-type N-terminal cleavage/methylation domain-containing protein